MTEHAPGTRATDYPPVKMHLASIEPGLRLGGHAPARPQGRRLVARLKTYVLTAAEPTRLIAPVDEDRVQVWITGDGTTGSIVGHSKGDVQNYADTTFASPPEDTLYFPPGSAALPCVPVPCHTTEALWAASPGAAGATTVKIRVVLISEVEEPAD